MKGLLRIRGRGELTDSVEEGRELVEQDIEVLETDERDNEVVSDTIDGIVGDGTDEGLAEVMGHLESADDIAVEKFETDSEELDRENETIEEGVSDLHERAESVERDEERIRDAREETEHGETRGELEEAAEGAREDREVFEEHEDELDRLLRESREEQEALASQVQSRRRR